jgi:outer membrane biosynthesis protein TonB
MNGNFFPKDAMRAGVLAEVMLAVRVDAAGNVLDVSPLRSRLVRGLNTAS